MALWDCRMIGAYPTQSGPMRGFVDAMVAAEREERGLLSLSLAHGFAHGDVPDAGTRMLAITDVTRIGPAGWWKASAAGPSRCPIGSSPIS